VRQLDRVQRSLSVANSIEQDEDGALSAKEVTLKMIPRGYVTRSVIWCSFTVSPVFLHKNIGLIDLRSLVVFEILRTNARAGT